MKSTLFYLPTQIAGRPIFGTGLLFWTILVVGILTVVRSLVRRKDPGDALFYTILTTLGLFVTRYVGPSLEEHAGFPVRGYGVMLTIAIALSGGLAMWRGKRKWNYPVNEFFTLLFVSAVCGILGARCFYVAQYWHEYQSDNLRDTILAAINITNGGLVVYGSIIGGTIAAFVYLLYKKLPVFATLDLLMPSLMLGVAIGRIGCFLNGCCFGGPCDLPWAVSFPPGSPAYMQQLDEGVISLYGLTLAPPQESGDPEKTFFSVKSKHVSLASETPSEVVVAAVDPGSAAEDAGIKPGDTILEMGSVAGGFFSQDESGENNVNSRKISRFRPRCNAQVFYFFLNLWDDDDEDVWMVLRSPAPKPVERNVVFHPKRIDALPVHPTQLYSSFNAFVICLVLLIIARFVKRDGIVVGLGFILYAINRFGLELIRTDEESFLGTGLTISQCVSVCVFIFGLSILAFVLTRPAKLALEGRFPVEYQDKGSADDVLKS